MFMRFVNTALAVVAVLLFSHDALADLVTFDDADFNNVDWSFTTLQNDPGASWNAFQVSTGGNPGAYRNATIDTGSSGIIRVGHYRTDFSYNPSVSGEIDSYRGTFDAINIDLTPSFVGWQFGMLLRQNSSFYITGPINNPSSSWNSNDTGTITSANFNKISGAGPTNPDFSSTGGNIEFGYMFDILLPSGGADATGGFDNFNVTLNTTAVPEASSFLMLAVVVIGTTITLTITRRRSAAGRNDGHRLH